MKSSFCIDLQRFMLIPTKFPLSPFNVVITTLKGHNGIFFYVLSIHRTHIIIPPFYKTLFLTHNKI